MRDAGKFVLREDRAERVFDGRDVCARVLGECDRDVERRFCGCVKQEKHGAVADIACGFYEMHGVVVVICDGEQGCDMVREPLGGVVRFKRERAVYFGAFDDILRGEGDGDRSVVHRAVGERHALGHGMERIGWRKFAVVGLDREVGCPYAGLESGDFESRVVRAAFGDSGRDECGACFVLGP